MIGRVVLAALLAGIAAGFIMGLFQVSGLAFAFAA